MQCFDVGAMQIPGKPLLTPASLSPLHAQIGKDRTGLIVALILATCGATEDEIVSDYARSDSPDGIALGGLEKMKELEGAHKPCTGAIAFELSCPACARSGRGQASTGHHLLAQDWTTSSLSRRLPVRWRPSLST